MTLFSEHFNNKRTDSIHKSVSNLNRSGFFLFTKVEERGKNGAYDLRVVPKAPWLDTIWMRKDDFVSYIIPSESEWKDVRSGETGLSSRAREPILICTHLDFWPHSFSLVDQLHHQAHKTTIHFFSRPLYFHRVIHGSMYLHAYFFSHPQEHLIANSN